MQSRVLGASGLTVSAIGLGCAGLSEGYGTPDDEQSLRTLAAALESGTTFFDTADLYGNGHNEALLARFIVERPAGIVISTKCGVLRKAGAPLAFDNSPAYVRSACDASLRRLRVETIDLYFLQRRDSGVPVEEAVDAMARLVREGKVRAIGLCEVSSETLRRANAVHPISAVQSEYSLCSRGPEARLIQACAALGVVFVAYCPLSRALLTDTLPDIEALESGDFRRRLPRFQSEALRKNRQLLPHLQEIASRHGATSAQIALAWLIGKHPHVIPIPGTQRAEHARENAKAAHINLSAEEIADLDRVFGPTAVAGDRYPPPAMAGIEAA